MSERGHEIRRPENELDLPQLRTIVIKLGSLAGLTIEDRPPDVGGGAEYQPSDSELVAMAELELRWRSKRNEMFGLGAMFGEPTWELLLDLFVQSHRNVEVTVTNACLATGTPITTALRYLSALIAAGFIARKPSSQDRRMHLVKLTPQGHKLVRKCLVIQWEGAGDAH